MRSMTVYTVFTRVIHAIAQLTLLIQYLKNYRYNQIYLRKIVSSHKSRTLNLDTKFWLKKCVNYASKYGISLPVVCQGAGKRPYTPTFCKVEFNIFVLASRSYQYIYYIDQSPISLNSNKTDISRKMCLFSRKSKDGVVVLYFE